MSAEKSTIPDISTKLTDRLNSLNGLGTPYGSIIAAAIVMQAPQDTNGNPRKLILVYDVLKNELLSAVSGGYIGVGKVIECIRRDKFIGVLRKLCDVNVTVKEFNVTVRLAKSMGNVYTEL